MPHAHPRQGLPQRQVDRAQQRMVRADNRLRPPALERGADPRDNDARQVRPKGKLRPLRASTSPRPFAGDYFLTPGLRQKLKKPLGRFLPSVDVRGSEFRAIVMGGSLVFAVGDRVTATLLQTTGR